MERPYPSVEFEAILEEDGTITIPSSIAKRMKRGERLTIRMTKGVVSKALRRRNITEEEIERISTLQLEQRENVIRFFESEGALAGERLFLQRAAAMMRTIR